MKTATNHTFYCTYTVKYEGVLYMRDAVAICRTQKEAEKQVKKMYGSSAVVEFLMINKTA